MSIYLVAYQPDHGREERDKAAIEARYQSSAQFVAPGIWVVVSGPNSGLVHEIFQQVLGYTPRRCLVSSVQADNLLRLDLEKYPEDSDLEYRLKQILPEPDYYA